VKGGMMDVKIAAQETDKLIDSTNLPLSNAEYGKDHLHEMVNKITCGEISGEQAHRWLGYLQGAVVIGGSATLEQIKLINYGS